MIFNRVPNIDKPHVSVHCHDDLGMAVENSLRALNCGVRQIECSINGLGARKGNADLEEIAIALRARCANAVLNDGNYQIDIDTSLINTASELVTKITGIRKKKDLVV